MIKPSSDDDQYNEIQTTTCGKNIIIISNKRIDIYDLTWPKVSSFPLVDKFAKFKIFNDKVNDYLLIIEKDT